uniref:HAT C-terminal dimerisation domain-containing protein n=1 Tax=Latimeria chalumnae TaxID=7897 RepID=H3B709_LATCH
LKVFSLMKEISWSDLESAVESLGLSSGLDVDALYSESVCLRQAMPMITTANITCEDKWRMLFEKCSADCTKLVQFMMSIPVSNSFTERVFSRMGNAWTNERHRLEVDVVKAELQCKLNFDMSCSEVYEYVSKKPELLKAAKSNKKYNFLLK